MPALPPHIPTPPPASFPSPAQVREQGLLFQDSSLADKRIWKIEWEGVSLIIKEGEDVEEGEAKVTELARISTGLPIPQVYHVEKDADSTFLYLEEMPGEELSSVYWQLPPGQQRALSEEIKRVVKLLHGVKAPSGIRVGGFGRRTLSALLADCDLFPSLSSTAELHTFLQQLYITKNPSKAFEYESEVSPHLDNSAPLVLVHGDLHADNILVQDGKLCALLDFERAGFYPEWVEACVATRRLKKRSGHDMMVGEAVTGMRAAEREKYQWMMTAWDGWLKSA
ncbi:hypothetical protein JCM10213_003263 [Rhodosporidiobolus nylandii]